MKEIYLLYKMIQMKDYKNIKKYKKIRIYIFISVNIPRLYTYVSSANSRICLNDNMVNMIAVFFNIYVYIYI